MSDEYNNQYNSGYDYRGSYDGAGDPEKKKKRGKGRTALLVVILAAVFGVLAGLGAFAINRTFGKDAVKTFPDGSIEWSFGKDGSGFKFFSRKGSGDAAADAEEEEKEQEEKAESAEEKEASDSGKSAAETVEKAGGLELVKTDPVETSITQVAENVMPAIVSVYNLYTVTSQDWFGQTYSRDGKSTGSGIIISLTDDELLVATNNHVVEGEDSLEVQFIDEETAVANIKGTDPDNDLAVIAVSLEEVSEDTLEAIRVATLGDSDNLKIGEPVVAIGNALGYGQSVTSGIISALNREMRSESGGTEIFIQTDAAINPGNSGGALVDLHGNVIGINSSKIGSTEVEGMCYAIPTARAVPIINNLMAQSTKTKVLSESQGYLGIRGVSVTSQVANAYNMPQGVYVAELIEGTGAAESEMKKGDIITHLDGAVIRSMEELQKQLQYYEAGQEIPVTVRRADKDGEYVEKEITVTLSKKENVSPEEDESESERDNSRGQDNNEGRGGSYYYGFPFGGLFGF